MQRIYSLSVVRSRVVDEFSMIPPALVGMCPPSGGNDAVSVYQGCLAGVKQPLRMALLSERSALMRTRLRWLFRAIRARLRLSRPGGRGSSRAGPARPRAPPKPRAENMFSKYRRCSRPETTACHRMSGIAYAVCSKGRRCSASVRSCVKGCWHGLIMRVARSQDAAVWCHFVSLLRRTDVESPL